jgi:HAD superfamily hydrolase (TIGR01509 family)
MSFPGVVSFDLDGTLWEFQPMMDGAIQAAIEALEARVPELAGRLTLADLHEHRRLTGHEMEGSLEQLRRASLRRALRSVGRDDPDLADWMADRLLEARAERVPVHGDVLPAIEALVERGYAVGAITNGNFPFHRLELSGHFGFVVHAEQVAGPKPGPEPFARAVELAGGRPDRWVHVGDDVEIDVGGAQAFGMRGVWLNRFGVARHPDIRPDAEIAGLDELPAVVDRLLG